MDILMLPFETPLTFTVEGHTIKLIAFKTLEHGNIKFGIDAPRSLKVNREEIYLEQLKKKQEESST